MSTTYYICAFNKDSKCYQIGVPSIGEIQDGFWINDKYEFTKASDCSFWIPPSQIQYVQKRVI